jgi:hypothetical protein
MASVLGYTRDYISSFHQNFLYVYYTDVLAFSTLNQAEAWEITPTALAAAF